MSSTLLFFDKTFILLPYPSIKLLKLVIVSVDIPHPGWGGEYHWKYYEGEEKGITLKELEEERARELLKFEFPEIS